MAQRVNISLFDVGKLNSGYKESFILEFDSGESNRCFIPANTIKGKEKGPVLLVMAGVHGDEYEGVQTIIELFRRIEPRHIRGTLVMVPVSNVLSYYGISRTTPEDGLNLAREFPGNPQGSITQRLAWHLSENFISRADFLLDLHSGGTSYAIPELVGYYHNEDNELGRRCRQAAEAFGIRVTWGHPYIPPGRTISTALDRGIPSLYTEAFGGRRIRPVEQANFHKGVYRLMDHLHMLLSPEPWLSANQLVLDRIRLVGGGDYDESYTSRNEGFFIPQVELLDIVKTGDLIGTLYNWYGEELRAFHAHDDGVIVGLTGTPVIQCGGMIYTLTKTEEQWLDRGNDAKPV